ncbi:hypothetical protein Ahy_B08g094089 [Arachis hypogaea]|uniref:Polyprotein n=1 Tax=Arachis hypogaea TaxID=3818 RepID=A0A444Y7Z3_ARAHY|nr:hypothetical protein Ahy_B08g094089 [Arachis hypogaea]
MIKRTKLSRKSFADYPFQPVDTIPCIATLRSYEEEFPPLVTQTDEKKITRRPYVIPQGITPHGHQATTPQEEVLNWHTDNAVSQNKVLLRIDHTLDTLVEKTEGLSVQLSSMAEQVAELKDRLSAQAFQLDQELKAYIDNRYFGPEFQKKNRELDQVKAQLRQIEMDKSKTTVPQTLSIDPLSMYAKPYPSYSPVLFPSTYSPPETPDYDSIFKSTYHLARQANTKRSISPQGRHHSSLPRPPQSQSRHHPPWKPGNFFRDEASSNVPMKDKGIKEGSPAPGRSIYTLTLDTQSPSEEITEESEDETTETSEQEDEESEGDYEADLSAKAMIDGTPRPHFDLKVKTSVYDKPIKAVALMDTGSCATVVKPHVLPKEMWAPFSKKFAAANSELLTITQIHPNPKYFDMDTPFCTIPIIQGPIPEEMMWYIWALSSLYPCAIIIPLFPVYHILCNSTQAQSHLVKLFAMYAPLGAWRGMLYNMIEQHQLWDKPSRTKRKFCCFVTLQRDYFAGCKAHNEKTHTKNKVDIVGYSTIWPTDEKTVLNALAKYLCQLWQPGLYGEKDVVEGLPFQSDVPPITLQEFQSRFITSGIINQFGQYSFYAPTDLPSTSTQAPSRYSGEDLNSEDPGGRVYALPPSPTRIDAGIPDDAEGPKSDPYDPYLQDAQDPNEENTEDPFLYLQDPDTDFRAVNLASDSSFSDGDGTLPEDYFKPSLY